MDSIPWIYVNMATKQELALSSNIKNKHINHRHFFFFFFGTMRSFYFVRFIYVSFSSFRRIHSFYSWAHTEMVSSSTKNMYDCEWRKKENFNGFNPNSVKMFSTWNFSFYKRNKKKLQTRDELLGIFMLV